MTVKLRFFFFFFFFFLGGPYSGFAGRDASRGLATFNVSAINDEYDDLSDLKPSEIEQVCTDEWLYLLFRYLRSFSRKNLVHFFNHPVLLLLYLDINKNLAICHHHFNLTHKFVFRSENGNYNLAKSTILWANLSSLVKNLHFILTLMILMRKRMKTKRLSDFQKSNQKLRSILKTTFYKSWIQWPLSQNFICFCCSKYKHSF